MGLMWEGAGWGSQFQQCSEHAQRHAPGPDPPIRLRKRTSQPGLVCKSATTFHKRLSEHESKLETLWACRRAKRIQKGFPCCARFSAVVKAILFCMKMCKFKLFFCAAFGLFSGKEPLMAQTGLLRACFPVGSGGMGF